jgi:hypothetical protein
LKSTRNHLSRYVFLITGVFIFSSFSITKTPIKSKRIICTEYTEKYVDKVTGIKRFIAKEKLSINDFKNKNGFDLVWFKTKDEYTLAFKSVKKMCFDNDIAVSFHLLEGKVITCPSSHISNCESLMTVNFEGKSEQVKKISLLSSSEVVGISFDNGNESYKLKLLQDHAIQFQQTLNCLKDRN